MATALNTDLILSQLDAPSLPDRIDALRRIKNDVVGHRQRKERWVHNGVIGILVRALASATDGYGAGKTTRQPSGSPRPFTQVETMRLHVIQLLTSFAIAGPAFLPPLHAAGTLPVLLDPSCLRSDQPQIILATLRALQSIAKTTPPPHQAALADTLFTNDKLELFLQIMSQRAPTPVAESQTILVADLIRTLCRSEQHQNAMVDTGILDALATRLAGVAAAAGYVLPRAEILAQSSGLLDFIPEPAISDRSLENVLGAIAAIIIDSPFRACKLLFSPSILAIFPNTSYDWSTYSKAPSETAELPGLRPTRQTDSDPMDLFLPQLPTYSHGASYISGASASKENLPLKARSASRPSPSPSTWTSRGESPDAESEEAESPLVPWLIHLVRSRSDMEAVMAASVLTSLVKAGFAFKSREAALGLLVVPILIRMLNDAESKYKDDNVAHPSPEKSVRLRLLSEASRLLSLLITDSELLQKAAFEAGGAKILCKILKNTYEVPLPKAPPRPWSADPDSSNNTENIPAERKLGDEEEVPGRRITLQIRGSALLAIGALAAFKEEYRKAIIDQDAVPYILQSLQPSPQKPKEPKDKPAESLLGQNINDAPPSEYGNNPPSVIETACYVIRVLSRSVGILRTTLVDHGVSIYVFRLLHHVDLKVQVAATATICNLVPNFSPMRETLNDYGVLKVLCEHAHSLDPALRLNALWALKHLVDSSSVELKKRCVEELGPGWLVRLICDDTEDEALFSTRTRGSDEMDEDTDMGVPVDYGHSWQFYKTPSTSRQQQQPELPLILRLAEARLAALQEAETDPVRKARHDDLAIQEQGLGFIRNLIGGAHPNSTVDPTDTTEMIDYLFNTLGQDRLFDILASKLRAKVLHPFSRRGAGSASAAAGTETRIVPPHSKVIEAVIYILVHIAASVPQHRQIVMAQTALLQQLVRLLDSTTPFAGATPTEPATGAGSSNSHQKSKNGLGSANGNSQGGHGIIPTSSGSRRRSSGGGGSSPARTQSQSQSQSQAQAQSSHSGGNDKEIRLALCYLVNNLSWQENDHDAGASSQRAGELRRLGFQSRLDLIAVADDEYDVRERAKSALWQMKQGL